MHYSNSKSSTKRVNFKLIILEEKTYFISCTIKAKVKNSVRFGQLIDGINKLH